MKRLLSALVVLGYSISCSGKSPSPTTPGPAQNTTPTRVIVLAGDLAFGDVAARSTATKSFTISNSGTAPLTVTGMTAPSAAAGIYRSSWVSGSVAPGASQSVTITFAPAAAISYNGTLTVSADHTSGSNSLAISGAGAPSSKVSLIGVITSSAGQRLTGITLRILDGANSGRTTTTTNGDYRFDDLAVGNANLSATGIGFAQLIRGLFINGANTLDFSLSPASPVPPPSARGRIGARCRDGSSSTATGSGACSHHGGVQCWRYSDGTCTNL